MTHELVAANDDFVDFDNGTFLLDSGGDEYVYISG